MKVAIKTLAAMTVCVGSAIAESSDAKGLRGDIDQRRLADECQLAVSLTTDNFPGETAWEVRNIGTGNRVLSGNNYNIKEETFNAKRVIPEGRYRFKISDAYGDGICCGYGQGSYSVRVDGKRVASGGQFQEEESVDFRCGKGGGCDVPLSVDVQASDPDGISWRVKDRSGDIVASGDFGSSNIAAFRPEDSLPGITSTICGNQCYFFSITGPNSSNCPYTILVDGELAAEGGIFGCNEKHKICPYLPTSINK